MALDLEFISRAEKVTSFNLNANDFTSLKHKDEIQHLFNKHFFPSFDLKNTIEGGNISADKINRVVSSLRSVSSNHFNSLVNYNLKGVGPGEVMLYFILKEAYLGGGASAGADIYVGSKAYECKAVKVSSNGEAYNFKLGGTLPIPDFIVQLDALRQSLGIPGSKTEISSNNLKQMKERAPDRYGIIEKTFAEMAYERYFKHHNTIFINNNTASKAGNIEAIKIVNPKEIMFDVVTSGTIKPRVKL